METINYFAYGANMNKLALKNRNIFPSTSKPAILRGYRLEFRDGFGNVTRDPDDSTHGVFHILTAKEMEAMDVIEGNGIYYKRTSLPIELYEKNANRMAVIENAFVYVGPDGGGNLALKIPAERYIKLLICGAEEHGVEKSYIDILKKVDYMPSKKLEAFLKLPAPLPEFKDKLYTIQEYEQLTKSVDPFSTKIIIFGCNKKVIKVTPQQAQIFQYAAHNLHGLKDVVMFFVKNQSDPNLPAVNSEQDLIDIHRYYVEDILMTRLSNLEVIGSLKME